MRSLFWLLAVFAAAVALVILGRVDAGLRAVRLSRPIASR